MTSPDLSLAWSFHDRGVGTAPLSFARLDPCYTPMIVPNASKPNVDSNSVGVGEWSLRAPSSSVALAATDVLLAALLLWRDSRSKAFHWKGVSQSFVFSCRADFGLRRMPRRRTSLIGRYFYPMALGSLFTEGGLYMKHRHTNQHK